MNSLVLKIFKKKLSSEKNNIRKIVPITGTKVYILGNKLFSSKTNIGKIIKIKPRLPKNFLIFFDFKLKLLNLINIIDPSKNSHILPKGIKYVAHNGWLKNKIFSSIYGLLKLKLPPICAIKMLIIAIMIINMNKILSLKNFRITKIKKGNTR